MSQHRDPHYTHSAGISLLGRGRWRVIGVAGAAFTLLLALWAAILTSPSATRADPAAAPSVFLPVILKIDHYNPPSNTTLDGGVYHFLSLNIPAGVTVTVLGDVAIYVNNDTQIAGSLVADCHTIAIYGAGDIAVTGALDNHCTAQSSTPGDLILHTAGGNLAMGTVSTPVAVSTSGNLDVANAPDLEEWEFDVLPAQRSASPLPPVCSASADTLEDTVVPGFPIEAAFTGDGADPDGGPVTYAWDFGDGITATLRDVTHTFTTWGVFDVSLTVTDDDGEQCQASLRLVMDDAETNYPDPPGLMGRPYTLVEASSQAVLFSAAALDPLGEAVSYTWQFGDGVTSTLDAPTHTYALPGHYPVTLVATDESGFTSTALSALYVYTPTLLEAATPQQGNCLVGGPNVFNVVYNGNAPAAAASADGHRAWFRGRGDIFLGMGTDIQAQHGGDGVDRTGSGDVAGGRGGKGGELQILVEGHLTVCAPASFAAGDGGDGGDANSDTPAPGMAWAKGGNGGDAARLLRISATGGLEFQAPFGGFVTLNPGSGGAGGYAYALGGNGDPACPTGDPGASAKATGGNGGNASKTALVFGGVVGLANAQLAGGNGGVGGDGDAYGGDGGAASCVTVATGGVGKPATGRGGKGGEAKLQGQFAAFAIAPGAFTAGAGGSATAMGGDGGDATAIPAGACAPATATGGQPGAANAYGGDGGKGRTPANGGNATGFGGDGGSATATGGDCTNCGDGGPASATAAKGANAEAKFGKKGAAPATDGTASAYGGTGGPADANGGRGGDCPNCPGGQGGLGGPANATGGNGGNAAGNGDKSGGSGGDGDAQGGRGGDGADCCVPNPVPGGDGGNGGNATSIAGAAGAPGGLVGANATAGGDGGNGGDGKPNGVGGDGGIGSGSPVAIPNGAPGNDGLLCLLLGFIYHSNIPDGGIIPGTTITLTVYPTTTTSSTPIGQTPAYFMTQDDLGHPVQYFKNIDTVIVQAGGIVYDLRGIPPTQFPTTGVDVTVNDGCGIADCLQLIGYFEGTPVGIVTSQAGTGLKTLSLPAPTGAPFYDSFRLIGYGPFSFFHWWVIIIDP